MIKQDSRSPTCLLSEIVQISLNKLIGLEESPMMSFRLAVRGLTSTRLVAAKMSGVRIVVGSDGDDNVDEDEQAALEVVRFLVAEEGAYNEHSEDERDGVENFELQVHPDVETPANYDDERGVQEGSLDGSAEDVGKGKVHLAIISLVDSEDVFWVVLV